MVLTLARRHFADFVRGDVLLDLTANGARLLFLRHRLPSAGLDLLLLPFLDGDDLGDQKIGVFDKFGESSTGAGVSGKHDDTVDCFEAV
jgi:hypothetical protein